jgi:uncharacterized protein (DUF2336 family)
MALTATLGNPLSGKDEAARIQIALRIGERLTMEDLPPAERLAAEALARDLVRDAIERVRIELSNAVKRARHLPKDIALAIARDIDSVACPFLEATEVFSDAEWEELIVTLSRAARVAVARRTSMSEALALTLAGLGNPAVAATLADNPGAPMTAAVGETLAARVPTPTWVLERLSAHDDLPAEIATTLYWKVSATAREKLFKTYRLKDAADPIMREADAAALAGIVRETPAAQLPFVVHSLQRAKKLSPPLLLTALRDGQTEFFVAAMSALAGARIEHVRSVVLRGAPAALLPLLVRASVPSDRFNDIWAAWPAPTKWSTCNVSRKADC